MEISKTAQQWLPLHRKLSCFEVCEKLLKVCVESVITCFGISSYLQERKLKGLSHSGVSSIWSEWTERQDYCFTTIKWKKHLQNWFSLRSLQDRASWLGPNYHFSFYCAVAVCTVWTSGLTISIQSERSCIRQSFYNVGFKIVPKLNSREH